jgi:dihydrofolate reductase
MRKVIYSMNVSLDGFVEGPNHELDWPIIDEEYHTFVNDQQSEIDTYLYGRRLYELMVDYWPTADADPSAPAYVVEFARSWREMPKIVFSKTLEKVEWNSRLVRENIPEEITKLKAQSGKDMAVGGPTLASTFITHGLIDEFRPFFHPVVLGSGTPFLPALDNRINVRLVETRTFGSGVVYLRYQRTDQRQ